MSGTNRATAGASKKRRFRIFDTNTCESTTTSPNGTAISAWPATTTPASSRIHGAGRTVPSNATDHGSTMPKFTAAGLRTSSGTHATGIHKLSRRIKRVRTADNAASDPTTTIRGSPWTYSACGAGPGSPWCGASGLRNISSREGVGSSGNACAQ